MLIMLILFAVLSMALFVFEFPKNLDNTDDVPDKFKPFYAKGTDGKFVLDEDIHQKMDNSKLTSALDKERKKAKDLEKANATWKGLGLGETAEEAAAKLAGDVEEEEDGELADKKGVDKTNKKQMAKIKAESEAALLKTKQEYEGKLTQVEKNLKKQMIESEAISAISALKGAPDLLLPLVREKCLLVEEDGVYNVRVVDAEGDPRTNGQGGFLTIKDLVAEMRQSEIYSRAFEADGKSGSGKRPGSTTGSGDRDQKLTPIQKISRGLTDRNGQR